MLQKRWGPVTAECLWFRWPQVNPVRQYCDKADSFHGTVFSILHHRSFVVVANEVRGVPRIKNLLEESKVKSISVGIDSSTRIYCPLYCVVAGAKAFLLFLSYNAPGLQSTVGESHSGHKMGQCLFRGYSNPTPPLLFYIHTYTHHNKQKGTNLCDLRRKNRPRGSLRAALRPVLP